MKHSIQATVNLLVYCYCGTEVTDYQIRTDPPNQLCVIMPECSKCAERYRQEGKECEQKLAKMAQTWIGNEERPIPMTLEERTDNGFAHKVGRVHGWKNDMIDHDTALREAHSNLTHTTDTTEVNDDN